jgi:hypothetical protein
MSTQTKSNPTSERVAVRKLWWAALAAGAAAAVLNLLVFLIASGPLGIALNVIMPGSPDPQALSPIAIIMSGIFPALGAAVLLALLNRFIKRPFFVFQIIALVFVLLSLGGVLPMPVAIAIKVVLSLMHFIAAGAIVGVLSVLARE